MNQNRPFPAEGLFIGSPADAPETASRDYTALCVLSGPVGITADGRHAVYGRDGFLFLPPGQTALTDAGAGARILIFRIRSEFIQDHLNRVQLPVYSSELDPEINLERLRTLVLSLADHLRNQPSEGSLSAWGILYLILAELENLPLPEHRIVPDGRFRERTREIAEYISVHYGEPLTLTELAGVFFLTPQYLSSFFRKNFGMNFKAYLTEQRLFHSLRDLRNTRMTISEIALRNGFSSISAYRRNFLNAYHLPPSDYRTRYLLGQRQAGTPGEGTNAGEGAPFGEDGTSAGNRFSAADEASVRDAASAGDGISPGSADASGNGMPAEGRTSSGSADASGSGMPAEGRTSSVNGSAAPGKRFFRREIQLSAEIDTAKTPDHRPRVHRMINVGSAQNMMSDRFRTKLADFARRSHLRYVRIQGLISNSFIPVVLPHYEYYFRNTDILLTFLYENGLVPFIELTKLPPLASARGDSQELFVPLGQRFRKLLEGFLLHVTRRWPDSWLAEWKFELWMSPRDTPESYAASLKTVRSLIRSYISGAAVGGPGFHEGSSPSELGAVIRALVPAGNRPDFFSVCLSCTAGQDPEGFPLISPDENYPAETAARVRKALSSAGMDVPLYVTEWTSVSLPSAPVACSRYQAAFIAKTFFALDRLCDLAAYWLFCDFRQNTGGVEQNALAIFGEGLLSAGFVPYAPLYAWHLCAGFGADVVSEGSSYRFVRVRPGHYQLIVWNYAHFRSGTEAGSLDATDFDRIYGIFRETPALRPAFRLLGLKEGLYHVSRVFLGGFSGSLLDILIDEFTHSNIDKIDFLRNIQALSGYESSFRLEACVPEERSSYIQVRDALEVTALLPPHTVYFWDIRRQI